jgi:hypothetical protein
MVLAVDRRFFEAYIKILEIVLKKSRGEIPLPFLLCDFVF